jgi:hypothetical protein
LQAAAPARSEFRRFPKNPALWLNLIGTIPAHNSSMRVFWIPLLIVALFAIDRAYMDGQNADQVVSLVHWIGAQVANWTDDLLRPLRKMAGG